MWLLIGAAAWLAVGLWFASNWYMERETAHWWDWPMMLALVATGPIIFVILFVIIAAGIRLVYHAGDK